MLERIVRFPPKKHKCLKFIEQENKGCEIKWFKRTELHDILITDYTCIKKNETEIYAANPQCTFSRNANSRKLIASV